MRVSLPAETQRELDRLTFVSRRAARAGIGGEHVSRRPAPSTDFLDYRPYQPGDDFRRVDWNVYGRLGSLQVKVTEGRERLDVLLVLDSSSSMAYGEPSKLAFAAQLVSALAYVGTRRADTVRVACLGRPLQSRWPLRRRSRMPELLRDLSQLTPSGMVNLNSALESCVAGDVPIASLAIVISDLLSPDGIVSGLQHLCTRVADVAVVHLVAPDELEPRVSGELQLIDVESGATLELGVSLATLAAYRRRYAAWLEARETECRRHGLRYIRVHTDRPLTAVLLSDLRTGGLLK